MYYNENTIVYLNGKLVNVSDAKLDLYSQSLHYGYSVFEGIRSYQTVTGETKIFKAVEHFDRLQNSARAMNMPYHWTTQELIAATYDVLEENNLQNAYIRPVVYAPANMSFVQNEQSFIVIEAWQMKPFLGDKLLRVMTSSFQRPNPKAFKIEAKAGGHYVNSLLASHEAKAAGYDEALLSDMNGKVAEAPGANLFYEKDGVLITPAPGNILPGITRATVIEICARLKIEVREKLFTTLEFKQGDAAFFCGTAAEIIGLESIDDTIFPIKWNQSLGNRIHKSYQSLIKEEVKITTPVLA